LDKGEPGEDGFSQEQRFSLTKNVELVEGEEPVEAAEKAKWTTAFINDLPDGSFLYVEGGGKKDRGGKTVPRSLRHFPYKDAAGKIDKPHLRNAIARIPQAKIAADLKTKLQAKARRLLEGTKTKKAVDEKDLAFLRAVAEDVPDDVDADLAKALASHAEIVAQYRDDLPQDLAKALENIITLACSTEEATDTEEVVNKNDDPNEDPNKEDPKPNEPEPKPAAEPKPVQLSDEEVGRIAAKVAEVLQPLLGKTEAKEPADDEEVEVTPAEFGQGIAEAVVEAIEGKPDS